MPKVVILDPKGVRRGRAVLKAGDEHEIPNGPHLDAWLRFGQVKLVPASKAESEKQSAKK